MTEYVVSDEYGTVHGRFDREQDAYSERNRLERTDQNARYGVTEEAEENDEAEQIAEDILADEDTTMSSAYTFIGGSTEDESQDFDVVGNKWTLGDHETTDVDETDLSLAIGEAMDSLDSEIDSDKLDVLQDASDLVATTDVTVFQCPVEACGLGHSHADHKHDIRSGFNVRDEFAEQMDFCPYCHCGVNELSMLMAFFPYISEQVFTDEEDFEGIRQIEPDDLEAIYRAYEGHLDSAVRQAAVSFDVVRGIEDDLVAFFNRRSAIENAADSAPIPQETRGVIGDNRDELEAVVSA